MVAGFHDAGLEVIQMSRVVFIVGSAVSPPRSFPSIAVGTER
jgi:hypothetical protein